MHDALREALDLVLSDLQNSGAPAPFVRDDDWAHNPQMASALLNSPDRSIGVRVMLDRARADRIADVADQLQDWAIEELRGRAAATWPACPIHPDSHPLTASVDNGVALWVCPRDGRPIGAIGRLTEQLAGS